MSASDVEQVNTVYDLFVNDFLILSNLHLYRVSFISYSFLV